MYKAFVRFGDYITEHPNVGIAIAIVLFLIAAANEVPQWFA